jgi:hypothetical protein
MRDVATDYFSLVHDIGQKNERRQIALHRLFGLTHFTDLVAGPKGLRRVTQGAEFPPIPAFSNLREAYVSFTGDDGVLHFGKRVTQTMSTFTFISALANTVNNLLVKAYQEVDYRLPAIVTTASSAENFKALDRTRVKFVADLEEVAEDAPYDEVGSAGDEGYSFSVSTRGGFFTVTERAVLANNIQGIQRAVEQLARSAARTLAKRAWGRMIANDIYGVDALPMFHADHGNLGSAALSLDSLNAARAALFAQTEPGSDQRLGLGSGPLLLAVPIELEGTARTINGCQGAVNAWYGRFGPAGERIFVNPLFTSPTDWYLLDISGKVGILEVAYLFGKQMPEVVLSDDPRRGSTFSRDCTTYKMRHEYEVAIEDYRGAFKSVVI